MVNPRRAMRSGWLNELGKNPSYPDAMSSLVQGYLRQRGYNVTRDADGAFNDPSTRAKYDQVFDAVMTQRHSEAPDMMGLTPAERAGFFDDWRDAYDSIRHGSGGLFGLPSIRSREYGTAKVTTQPKPRPTRRHRAAKRTGIFSRIKKLFKRG